MCLSNNSDTVMSKNTNVKGEARSNLSPKCSVQMLNERKEIIKGKNRKLVEAQTRCHNLSSVLRFKMYEMMERVS